MVSFVTQGPVSIVCKLYQFHIVTVVELRSVSYNFVLGLIVASIASSYYSQFCPLSKRSRNPSMKVMENLEMEEQLR